VHRQMRFEGGFQGRTNKLVDGCYSFWQGGLFPLVNHILQASGMRKGHCSC
jgi:protein farnesyltransferase subunit beta